ncbi:MAG: V-type ATP synthase subunit E [Bacilli bacterium]|jgi:vacuolar-type H+-ATPase subunit E/Vma4|nr:V-type ATP synthase subunit E [Bacilli bacterium]MDD2681397.1 V-type ATP synthase subunit E [Bacilli bacterium]MDD3120905.1 V-type ATP synthase subunit E [Bacilli bacterium]MDD4063100.1 V-type ATP synthase subunit E [Bacilli bacterium]MDD4481620.1 V-type ATP synthase subunit E [Bacilli bacterium]
MEKQDIYKKIEDKGKQEAQKIIFAGEQEAQAIKKEILEKAEAEILIKNKELSKYINEELVTKESVLKQKEKMNILRDKKNLMLSTLNSAFEKMRNMSDERLKDYVITIIKSESIIGDETILVSNTEYNRYLNLFSSEKSMKDSVVLDLLNTELGRKYNLVLSNEGADIDGGFLIISKTYDIDGSYKTILNNVLENNESEIAKILFSEEI